MPCDGQLLRPVHRALSLRRLLLEADLLGVAEGTAGLSIQRASYLKSGRVAELTRSLYRGDAYDFVAELRLSH